jgi:hypothetical protein
MPEISDEAVESIGAAIQALKTLKTEIVMAPQGLQSLVDPDQLAKATRLHRKLISKTHELGAELTEALLVIEADATREIRRANAETRDVKVASKARQSLTFRAESAQLPA